MGAVPGTHLGWDVPNVGYWRQVLQTNGSWRHGRVYWLCHVDNPSGRGRDETSWAIVKMLNGYLYVPDAGGMQGGYGEDVLKKLSLKAKKHKVNYIIVESNFGDGMFSELFKPYLSKVHPCTIEEVRHSIQKEKRIIDTLEPVLSQHKLVMSPDVIRETNSPNLPSRVST